MDIVLGADNTEPANYVILLFRAENVRQQIVFIWRGNDSYADDIIKRITDSIELKSDEAVEDENDV